MIRFAAASGGRAAGGWDVVRSSSPPPRHPSCVLVFGGRAAIGEQPPIEALLARFPAARLAGCSTAGDILDTEVSDEDLVATALAFDATRVMVAAEPRSDAGSTPRPIGERLAARLAAPDLAHVLVLSEGVGVNGSELVRGLASELPPGVTVTGGLAGDGARFDARPACVWDGAARATDGGRRSGSTATGCASATARSAAGTPFGPERLITRSSGNVLYELDGRPALDLYKQLPGGARRAACRRPACSSRSACDSGPGRSRWSARSSASTRRGSHDLRRRRPGGPVRPLMRANFDRLIDGAAGAASASQQALGERDGGARPADQLRRPQAGAQAAHRGGGRSVRDVLGAGAVLAGFYSYGEISPFSPGARCELHNQTMTITTLSRV